MGPIYKSAAGADVVLRRYAELMALLPLPTERIHLSTSAGKTFVLACGPKDAPPLVLLHGSGGNSVGWWHELAIWSKRFRVYAVDMLGEPGLSDQVRYPLGSDVHASWLDQVLDALSVRTTHLVGISLGGWFALDYATQRPQRVERLALLCPGGLGRQKRGLILWLALPLSMFGRAGRRRSMELLAGRMPPAGPGQPDLMDFTLLTFSHFNPRLEPLPPFGPERLSALAATPVFLVVGGKDAMFDSAESVRILESHLPHLSVRFLPEAPHGLTGQGQAVRDFFAGGATGVSLRAVAEADRDG